MSATEDPRETEQLREVLRKVETIASHLEDLKQEWQDKDRSVYRDLVDLHAYTMAHASNLKHSIQARLKAEGGK